MKPTRFHLLTACAVLIGAGILAIGRPIWLVAVLLVFAVVLGLGVALPQLRLFGPFICRGPATNRAVALTFDDGPDVRSTPALLDLLREAGVSAAFFCIGKQVAAHPELVARIAREGHLLGNHSYGHSNATNFFTVSMLRSELELTQSAIRDATSVVPQLFRPPMGLSNPRVFRAARELGLSVIGWSTRGLDTIYADPQRIVARITRRLKPGAIILLHDGNVPADRLVATVKSLLDRLRAESYEVVRLDRLLSNDPSALNLK